MSHRSDFLSQNFCFVFSVLKNRRISTPPPGSYSKLRSALEPVAPPSTACHGSPHNPASCCLHPSNFQFQSKSMRGELWGSGDGV